MMFYCTRVVVEAPSKVNLSLDIKGTTGNGYHLLESVMQSINLCDVVVVGKRDDYDVAVTCSNPRAPVNDMNIAYKASLAFFAATGLRKQGLSIHIDKAIPMEAGLAGGSADAAAVLRGLDRLFETDLTERQLEEIALDVGSDVPFCLRGGCAFAEGRGEMLTNLAALPSCYLTIAKPPKGMSTKFAFKLYDDFEGQIKRPNTKDMLAAIGCGDLTEIGKNMHNVFQSLGQLPQTEMLSGVMLSEGAYGAVMTGSGSAVVGLFGAEKDAKHCLHLLKEQVRQSWVAKPTDFGARIIHVG